MPMEQPGASAETIQALDTFVYVDSATRGVTEYQLRQGPIPDTARPACAVRPAPGFALPTCGQRARRALDPIRLCAATSVQLLLQS
jgi:hypothetical protein